MAYFHDSGDVQCSRWPQQGKVLQQETRDPSEAFQSLSLYPLETFFIPSRAFLYTL
eukprot:gene8479-953_t